jgi:hypothetical protein
MQVCLLPSDAVITHSTGYHLDSTTQARLLTVSQHIFWGYVYEWDRKVEERVERAFGAEALFWSTALSLVTPSTPFSSSGVEQYTVFGAG